MRTRQVIGILLIIFGLVSLLMGVTCPAFFGPAEA
jgi:hypothetical protein